MMMAKRYRVHGIPTGYNRTPAVYMSALKTLLLAAIQALPISGPYSFAKRNICRVSFDCH
jgi:hypothetical protein